MTLPASSQELALHAYQSSPPCAALRLPACRAPPALYCTVVGWARARAQDGVLPRWSPDFRTVSDTPFQLTSFALSLMLVFRTNSSYARWLDARQQWGLIVNTSRTFVRQAMTELPEDTWVLAPPASPTRGGLAWLCHHLACARQLRGEARTYLFVHFCLRFRMLLGLCLASPPPPHTHTPPPVHGAVCTPLGWVAGAASCAARLRAGPWRLRA